MSNCCNVELLQAKEMVYVACKGGKKSKGGAKGKGGKKR